MHKRISQGLSESMLLLLTSSAMDAIRNIDQPITGFKNGRQTFKYEPVVILKAA